MSLLQTQQKILRLDSGHTSVRVQKESPGRRGGIFEYYEDQLCMYNENYQNSELVDDPEEAQSEATEVSMSADVEPMDFEYNPLSLFVDDQILE